MSRFDSGKRFLIHPSQNGTASEIRTSVCEIQNCAVILNWRIEIFGMEYRVLSLNYSNFKTVIIDLFGNDKALNGSIWNDSWGNPDQYSFGNGALTLTSSAADNWQPVGFMQAPIGKSAGEGYGLYQFTGYANAGQGTGIAFIMWRADNKALDASSPGSATELDILESWDGTKSGESTVHYYDSTQKNSDGNKSHDFSIDLTKTHTYAMDWERGSLTYYVDGEQIYQDTLHSPLDYADGGSNEVMGAELVNMVPAKAPATVQLHITEMEYSAPITASGQPPDTSAGVVTLGGGIQTYAATAATIVQAGGGSDTITATAGAVTVTGSSGMLTYFGGTAASMVSGGTGSSLLFSGTGGGSYVGGSAGNNILVSQGASGSNTTLTGGGAGDALFGSASGNDTLIARVGRESILGGGGNTAIVGGGTAASVIFTGSGTTTVTGGAVGGDTIVGGSGVLGVNADKGEAIFGGGGALTVNASLSGSDSIIGGAGALTVNGQGSNMLVVAGTTTSHIAVGNGAALVFGSTGASTVTGGSGWMEVVVGSGKMTVNEGTSQTFYEVVKGAAGGTDIISGFRPGTDSVSLYNYKASDIQVIKGSASTLISLSDGTKIQLLGVSDPGSSILT